MHKFEKKKEAILWWQKQVDAACKVQRWFRNHLLKFSPAAIQKRKPGPSIYAPDHMA